MSKPVDYIKFVSSYALSSIETLLARWLPDGKRESNRWSARNPRRDDRHAGSFFVWLDKGNFEDYATEDSGGDLIDLKKYLFGYSETLEAAEAIAAELGLPNFKEWANGNRDIPALPKPPVLTEKHDFFQIVNQPYPEVLPPLPEEGRSHSKFGRYAHRSLYRDANGHLLGAVYRFVEANGKKNDIPCTLWLDTRKNELTWRYLGWKKAGFEHNPLCGLDKLAARPNDKVLIVEGEKCKNAADLAEELSDFVVITWSGGCGNWHLTDWSLLSKRHIVLFPDADSARYPLTSEDVEMGVSADTMPFLPKELQAGEKAMRELATKLAEQDCTVEMVDLFPVGTVPQGWDIADALARGGDYHQGISVRAMLDERCVSLSAPIPKVAVGAEKSVGVSKGDNAPTINGVQTQHYDWALKNIAKIDGRESYFCIPIAAKWTKREIIAKLGKDGYNIWASDARVQDFPKAKVDLLIERKKAEIISEDPIFASDCNRYILIYGTTEVCDVQKMGYRGDNGVMSISALKTHMGKSRFEVWENSPNRLEVMKGDFGFFPFEPFGIARKGDEVLITEDGFVQMINTYNGLPFEKSENLDLKSLKSRDYNYLKERFKGCKNIMETIELLCNHDMRAVEWVLNWIAHRVRFPTAKQATALVVASPVQGAGKSLIFAKLLPKIFGRYGTVLGQADMESTFTAAYDEKMYVCYEEVSSQKARFDLAGRIKDQITSNKIRIERKGQDAIYQDNFIGFVYLSNYRSPVVVERDDRRFFVIAPEYKLTKEMGKALADEIDNDECVQDFVDLLFALPFTYTDENGRVVPFGAHTATYDTLAKIAMKEWSAYVHELFLKEWLRGDLRLPVMVCTIDDLHRVFCAWCMKNKEKIMAKSKFRQSLDGVEGCKVLRTNDINDQKTYFLVPADVSLSAEAVRIRAENVHGKANYYSTSADEFRRMAVAKEWISM